MIFKQLVNSIRQTTPRARLSLWLFVGFLIVPAVFAQEEGAQNSVAVAAFTEGFPAENTQQSAIAPHDGQHDFDFNIGTWKTHIRRLVHPLSGSDTWVELNGAVTVHKLWNGSAQWEEIEADGPNGHFQGVTLFLYSPQSHQWSQYFANSADGILDDPAVGQFQNGRGELFNQETLNGRAILVRIVWSDITSDSHHFEQSFSADGGKTWEPNFIATLTREKP